MEGPGESTYPLGEGRGTCETCPLRCGGAVQGEGPPQAGLGPGRRHRVLDGVEHGAPEEQDRLPDALQDTGTGGQVTLQVTL